MAMTFNDLLMTLNDLWHSLLFKRRVEKTGTFLPGDRNVPVFVKVAAKLRVLNKRGKLIPAFFHIGFIC